MPRSFSVIVATASNMGIGVKGGLPWRLPSDMGFFKQMTSTVTKPTATRNAVIMGRRTWESIPFKFRPLSQRLNVIVTKSGLPDEAKDLYDLLDLMSSLHRVFSCIFSKLYQSISSMSFSPFSSRSMLSS
jgi:dihydrofolate reductase